MSLLGGANLKTIHEIQDNLHTLSEQLSTLALDLEELKGAYLNPVTFRPDEFEEIEAKAQEFPILNKNLEQASDIERQTYMRFLSIIAGADDSKLLMARRIGIGGGSEWDVERLAMERMTIQPNFPTEVGATLGKLRYSLVLDSLVIAHLSEEVDKDTIATIADMADLLKCTYGNVAIVAQVAAAVVQMNKELFDAVTCDQPLSGLSHLIPPEWLKPVYVGKFSNEERVRMVQNGWVKKGQSLFREKDVKSNICWVRLAAENENKSQPVKAPVAGIVHFEYKNKKYDSKEAFDVYICSPFDTEFLNK